MRQISACVGQIGCGPSFARALLDPLDEHGKRLVEELDRLEQRVCETGVERLLGCQHPVLAERVLDDELHRLLCSDQLWDQLRSSPARDQAQEYLGAGEVADRRGERPIVAVERDLDSATDHGTVDRRQGDEGKVTDPAEELVTGLAAEPRSFGCDLAELVDVCADGEDEWLSRQQQAAPVARPQLPEHLLERAESRLAEGVRLLPILAVVHGHQRDRACARLDPLELELRWGAHFGVITRCRCALDECDARTQGAAISR